MKKIFVVLITLTVLGCCFPKNPDTWTVMSWNVQNLFDGVDDGTEYSEFDPGKGNWNNRLFERRLDRVAEVILKAESRGADLVVLQELENENVLNNLVKGPLKGKGYEYTIAIPGFSIIRSGILSRYPIREVEVVDCGLWGERSLRPALGFSVLTPGGEVYVIALHWKSPRGGRVSTEAARRKEALVVRNMLVAKLSINPESRIIVVGDFNTPGDGEIEPAALGPYGTEAVLWRIDLAEWPPYDSTDIVLFDPEPSEGLPGTYNFRGEWDRPDRALLTSALVQGESIIFQDARISDLEIILDHRGYPQAWRTDLEEGYSDHLPLILKFSIPTP